MTIQNKDMADSILKNAVRSLPENAAPSDFSKRVMVGLEPKSISLWKRFSLWLTRPKSMTYTPLHVAPVLACAIALIGLAFLKSNVVTDEGPQLTPVRFVLSDQGHNAQAVSVIGSFNNWEAGGSNMWYDSANKRWVLEAMLPPGHHEYTFLVNGEKLMPDPNASMARDDGFGNKNSILFVDDHDALPL